MNGVNLSNLCHSGIVLIPAYADLQQFRSSTFHVYLVREGNTVASTSKLAFNKNGQRALLSVAFVLRLPPVRLTQSA